MISFFFGILIGIAILYKVGKKENVVEPKKEENTQKVYSTDDVKNDIKKIFKSDIDFSQDEIKKRQEKILGNFSETERKLFLNYIQENSKIQHNDKKKTKDKNQWEQFYDIIFNFILIIGIAGIVYSYMR